MNLAIHTGSQALAHLHTENFLLQWGLLYDACPWATAFQHPDFVTPWYELYQDRFVPVIAFAEDSDHSLIGLLTLAFHAGENKLVGAGERQAEYHAWLERGDAGEFIGNAVGALRKRFPGGDICLKYLPPSIPLGWIDKDRRHRKLSCLHFHRRPVMEIDEAAMERQRRKKNHRQNFNRLNKTGDVSFEKVSDHERFIHIFDELCIQYDFRQGALHHYMPFASDPAKKAFYLELHKRGMLHTSILKVGRTIAASHSGVVSKGKAVHLGINTHAPALAAHSPGNLLLAMLGVQLADEKMAILDLTPGGDGYKENFATEHDAVCEMMIYGGVARRWRKEAILQVKRVVKSRMLKAGWSTADALAAAGKLAKFKKLGIRGLLDTLRRKSRSASRVYRYCPEISLANFSPLPLSKNCLQDILLFEDGASALTRWEFLKTAMERMERSMDLYSYAKDEKLLISCWVLVKPAGAGQQLPGKNAASPDQSIVLFDLYVHHGLDKNRIIQRFIAQILSELKDAKSSPSIYFQDALCNELHELVTQCGFIDESGQGGDQAGDTSLVDRDMRDFSTGA